MKLSFILPVVLVAGCARAPIEKFARLVDETISEQEQRRCMVANRKDPHGNWIVELPNLAKLSGEKSIGVYENVETNGTVKCVRVYWRNLQGYEGIDLTPDEETGGACEMRIKVETRLKVRAGLYVFYAEAP